MAKLERFLTKLESYLSILFGVTMIVATLLIVFWRYVLNQPFTIGEELARYLTVWFIYIGIIICAKRKGHLGVEAFTMAMPEKVRNVIAVVADALNILLFALLLYCSILMERQYMVTAQKSTMMRLPMALVFAIVPASLLISTFHYLLSFIGSFRKTDEADTAAGEESAQ